MVLGKKEAVVRKIPTTLLQEVLVKYVNPIFVETGTANGGGVEAALNAGFEHIYSIEINQPRQLENLERFRGIRGITLITGDSGVELEKLIPLIDKRATFWLDAHFEKRRRGMRTRCPLYEELETIATSPIKDHTILIDDMRVVGKEVWGRAMSKDLIIEHLLKINSNYRISFEDNRITENDIMVAQI